PPVTASDNGEDARSRWVRPIDGPTADRKQFCQTYNKAFRGAPLLLQNHPLPARCAREYYLLAHHQFQKFGCHSNQIPWCDSARLTTQSHLLGHNQSESHRQYLNAVLVNV